MRQDDKELVEGKCWIAKNSSSGISRHLEKSPRSEGPKISGGR